MPHGWMPSWKPGPGQSSPVTSGCPISSQYDNISSTEDVSVYEPKNSSLPIYMSPIPGRAVSPKTQVVSPGIMGRISRSNFFLNNSCMVGNLQPSMSSSTVFETEQAFIWAVPCDLSGFPFSQAWNMQLESMARWRESSFQPKR